MMDTLANLLSSPKLALLVFGPLLLLGVAKGWEEVENRSENRQRRG